MKQEETPRGWRTGGTSAAAATSRPALSPGRCDVCCVTFRTHRGLLRHNALVHKQLPRDAVGRPFIQNNPAIPAGFHDLGFRLTVYTQEE